MPAACIRNGMISHLTKIYWFAFIKIYATYIDSENYISSRLCMLIIFWECFDGFPELNLYFMSADT